MDNTKNCSGCVDSDRCQAAYENAGKVKGPPVAGKVFLVFLLPIIIFIITLGLSEKYINGISKNQDFKTAIGVLLALSASLIYIFVVRSFKSLGKKAECPDTLKGETTSKPKES
jgi:hypothetical protein